VAHLLHWTAANMTAPEPSLDNLTSAAAWREQAVALSLLRGSRGTLAARYLKELTDELRQPKIPDDELVSHLAECLNIPTGQRHARWAEALRDARRVLASHAARGIDFITSRDDTYPPMLRHVIDPPIVLWTKGSQAILTKDAVAVVGSRSATPMALTIARRLGRQLAEFGIVVVSGMARGVDGAAHEGALDAGGETVAVLGSGPDIVYPREHDRLAARIASAGVIVSEFAPGTPSLPRHFPMRNRIISGVVSAVVVVEASERSGSLITARLAVEQGREVLAVPGNVLSGRSRGSHLLIRDGAGIVETAADVLEYLGWARSRHFSGTDATNSLQLNELEERMARGEPYSAEDLAGRTGRPIATLLADLGILELEGRIVRVAGGRYIRLD
jgi:DNA processing protein